jgi:hypothetical protein
MGAGQLEPVPMTWLINFLQPFNVRVSSTSGGRHVPTSYHWRHRACDVVGTPDELRRVARRALAQPASFREVFYDPMGRYVKNGVIRQGAIGGHGDHVHLAR